jgi:hypothetical protein
MEYREEQEHLEWGVPTHIEHEADRLYSGLASVSELAKVYCPSDIDQIIICNRRKYRIE